MANKKSKISKGKVLAAGVGLAALGAGAYYLLGPNKKAHQKKVKVLAKKVKKEFRKEMKIMKGEVKKDTKKTKIVSKKVVQKAKKTFGQVKRKINKLK